MSFPLDYKSHHAVSMYFCLSLDISITLSDELKHVSRLFKYIDGHKNKTFFSNYFCNRVRELDRLFQQLLFK